MPVNPEPHFNFQSSYWQWFNNLPEYYPLPFPMHINKSFFSYKFLQRPLELCPSRNPADIFIESTNSANVVAPSDVVENNGVPRNGIKYISKTDDTIGGALSEELKSWRSSRLESIICNFERPSIINAPPGYGKTIFVIRELRKRAYEQGYYILLIVNRSILKGQIARLISEGLSEHTVGDPEGSLSVYGNIVLCTYQYFLNDFSLIKKPSAISHPSKNQL